jgi:hypothetical protein
MTEVIAKILMELLFTLARRELFPISETWVDWTE